ncbi:MAG: acyl-CoA dehydrogenase family protein [Actinomycetota bacterium]
MTDWTSVATDVAERIEKGAVEGDRSGQTSHEAFALIRSEGISSALVPTEFGGGGVTHAEMGEMLRILGAADPSTAVTLTMHSHVVAAQVWSHNRGMDASGVLTKVAGGTLVASGGASDWIESSGTAEKVVGGFLVSARKSPMSGCEVFDILASSVRWDDAPEGPSVIHFPVPLGADEVTIEETWDAMGLRATGSHTIAFDGLFVPDEAVNLIRPSDRWAPIWSTILGAALPLIMSAYVGIADRAVSTALDIVKARTPEPPFSLIGEMLNAHTTGADAVEAMFTSAENLTFDSNERQASLALQRKTIASESLVRSVRLAMDVVGGASYSRALPLERLYRDVHGCLYHPLARGRQIEFSGRVATGFEPIV